MSVIIVGINKPKDCKFCRHNIDDLTCDLNKGFIDRDDWTCNKECPIKQLPDKYDLPVDTCSAKLKKGIYMCEATLTD